MAQLLLNIVHAARPNLRDDSWSLGGHVGEVLKDEEELTKTKE